MKEKQLFGRLGNKTTDIKYFKEYLPLECKNIVEPFGGTFAVIKNIYSDQKYKKYVNDNDETLYKIYCNPLEYTKLIIEVNNLAKNNLFDNGNVNYKEFIKEFNKLKYDDDLKDFYKKEKIVRGTLVKYLKSNIIFDKQIEFMKTINFSSIDYLECINKHVKNNDTFIFLDPPYLFSDNSNYSKQARKDGEDMTNMLYEILEVFQSKKTKAKIMMIINDMKIIRWMFGKYIKGDYNKIYQLGKRKAKHLIICNY